MGCTASIQKIIDVLSFCFKGHVAKTGILDRKSFEFDPTRINDKREVAVCPSDPIGSIWYCLLVTTSEQWFSIIDFFPFYLYRDLFNKKSKIGLALVTRKRPRWFYLSYSRNSRSITKDLQLYSPTPKAADMSGWRLFSSFFLKLYFTG